jgi:MFS family permease
VPVFYTIVKRGKSFRNLRDIRIDRFYRNISVNLIWARSPANRVDDTKSIEETRPSTIHNTGQTQTGAYSNRGPRRRAPGGALRHRNFQIFFGGQLISLIGTWIQNVALAWLVYRLSGSGLLLGSVGFAGQIPVFLLAPLGGVAADRVNRQRVIVLTQTVSMLLAFILAALTLTGRVRILHLFVLAALLGAVNAFDIPVRQAFLVDMVGKDDLMNAIAMNSTMINVARMIGPAAAGILLVNIGEGWCFFANGASYIAVIAGLLVMRVTSLRSTPKYQSPFADIMEGFRFVRGTAPIRSVLLLLGLVSLVGMPYVVLMPIFADRILHSGARGLGILMGATGLGAVLGALTLAFRRGTKGLMTWIPWCCCGFGAGMLLFSFSRSFPLSVLLLLPVSYCMLLQMACSNTLIQAMVPNALRGRVMAVYSMMFMGMPPFGALLGGTLADRFGAPVAVAMGAVSSLGAGLWFGARLPRIRGETRRLISDQAEMQAEILAADR